MKISKILRWLAGTCLVCIAALAGYFGITAYLPSQQPNLFETTVRSIPEARVTTATVLRLEKEFLCGNKSTTTLPVPKDLLGLQLADLQRKYLSEDGWKVSAQLPQVLELQKKEWDVCELHRNYRHLGSVNGYLAIFEGPIGVDKTLLQEQVLALKQLPPELAQQIAQAANFAALAPESKLELRQALEFQDEAALNDFLDNLDEYLRE